MTRHSQFRSLLAPLATALMVSTFALLPTPSAADPGESPDSDDGAIVIRLEDAAAGEIDALVQTFPITHPVAVLASRAIYLVHPSDSDVADDEKKVKGLAKALEKSPLVRYAEPTYDTLLDDQRYHSWPEGEPDQASPDADGWRQQDLAALLRLPEAHSLSTGAGTVVAVVDSGVDTSHPALSGRLVDGYDYIDDDADPNEVRQGVDSNGNGVTDESYGHGTFVAGVVSLVAPDATIMPMRVLDSDGAGSVYALATAVSEATDAGADVINLSLGTAVKTESKLLKEAIKDAQEEGVAVVAAAGNAASKDRQYPADHKDVLSVGSSNDDGEQLSAFSNYGDWVDVAAPAGNILGPVPGGGYAWWAGTSMAAPQVSGQLALIDSFSSDLDADKWIESITKTARKMASKQVKKGNIDLIASLDRVSDDD